MEEEKREAKAYELEPGMEFSYDGGVTWVVTRGVKYANQEDPASDGLDVWVQPSDDLRLSKSFHVYLDDFDYVLLGRDYVSANRTINDE